MITLKTIRIESLNTGIYLRWYFNGWHYYCFTNDSETEMITESVGKMTKQLFSRISKIEVDTKINTTYKYKVNVTGITPGNIEGFNGLVLAERVDQYESGTWREVNISRDTFKIKQVRDRGYELTFEVWRKDLPNQSSTYQKSQVLTIGATVCDLDDSEVIAITKQVNDIAEMRDRQSDFTATFKIRKTRAMKMLFELSGEPSINTSFPYQEQTAKLVIDGIEIITGGRVVLEKTDEYYYHISIYSGNISFFKAIEGRKLTDLNTTADLSHTWEAETQANSNAGTENYMYPLFEPSDDGGMLPLALSGDYVELYGGWIWPFVKIKYLFEKIFSEAFFTVQGKILTDPRFLKMLIPVSKLTASDIEKYLYSLQHTGYIYIEDQGLLPGGNLINGDANFAAGYYNAPYSGKYSFEVATEHVSEFPPAIFIYVNGTSELTLTAEETGERTAIHRGTIDLTAGNEITFHSSGNYFYQYTISVTAISQPVPAYSSPIDPGKMLPDMSQTEYIKTICNLFGLIPDTTSRGNIVRFWNYLDLYENIPYARNWSAYLSERDDECEFKFGDYAQKNYLKYKDTDDVTKGAGTATFAVSDKTLIPEKDAFELPVSTTDEVLIDTNTNFICSRIGMNEYNSKDNEYKVVDQIEARIAMYSVLSGITFGVRDSLTGGTAYDVVNPNKINSVPLSSMLSNYVGLNRMLTRTNLRRAKFNLPVFEVAGLRHDIPIYLNQYAAYFYVNKMSNYVAGKLCTVELIKL